MARKVHKIHSLPGDAPWRGGLAPAGSEEHPALIRALDKVLFLQRPLVLAHLRSIRLRHPDASTADIVKILEKRYLAGVTSGGAAVGATAVVPGIGTGVTLALASTETIGFLESTAMFAQSVAEVHGIAVTDPDRARALVLTLMLGSEGTKLIGQLTKQLSGKGASQSAFWGELVTSSLPKAAVGPVVDRLKSAFLHQLATRGSASIIGKAMPFGIGAAIGAGGNLVLGRRVITGARRAFGAPPAEIPADIEPRPGAEKMERRAVDILSRSGKVISSTVGTTANAAKSVVTDTAARLRRKKDSTPPDTISASEEQGEITDSLPDDTAK